MTECWGSLLVDSLLLLALALFVVWLLRKRARVEDVLMTSTGVRNILLCAAVAWCLCVVGFWIAGLSPWRFPADWLRVVVILSISLGVLLAGYLVLGVATAVALNVMLLVYYRSGRRVRGEKAKLKTLALINRWAAVHRAVSRFHGVQMSDLISRALEGAGTAEQEEPPECERRDRL